MRSKEDVRILFVHPHMAPFIKNDLEILKKHFEVVSVYWKTKKDFLSILKNILKVDITFSWFAGDFSFKNV